MFDLSPGHHDIYQDASEEGFLLLQKLLLDGKCTTLTGEKSAKAKQEGGCAIDTFHCIHDPRLLFHAAMQEHRWSRAELKRVLQENGDSQDSNTCSHNTTYAHD